VISYRSEYKAYDLFKKKFSDFKNFANFFSFSQIMRVSFGLLANKTMLLQIAIFSVTLVKSSGMKE
jgi:hypothetical protein